MVSLEALQAFPNKRKKTEETALDHLLTKEDMKEILEGLISLETLDAKTLEVELLKMEGKKGGTLPDPFATWTFLLWMRLSVTDFKTGAGVDKNFRIN